MSRHLLLASGLLLALGSAGAPADDKTSAPVGYAGRPLGAWVKDLDADDLLLREEAAEVLAALGPKAKEAVPALKKLLEHDSKTLRARAAVALWKITGEAKPAAASLAASLADADTLARRDAAQALSHMGPGAAPAAAALVGLLDDPDYACKSHASAALSRLGKAAIPALLGALKGKEVRLRRNAATQLVAMREAVGEDDLAAVKERLGDEDLRVRVDAARLLWLQGKADAAVTDALAAGAKAGGPATRTSILHALRAAPSRPKALVPVLEALVGANDGQQKIEAARLLYEVEKKPGRVLPIYLGILKDDYQRPVWSFAIVALGDLGAEARPAVPLLVGLLKQKDFHYHYEVTNALVKVGEPAVASLVGLLREDAPAGGHSQSHENAIQALGRLGDRSTKAVLALLDDRQAQVRRRGVRVLALIHPASKDSVTRLAGLLDDGDGAVREHAAIALGNAGPDAKAAAPKLLALAKERDGGAPRLAALRALMRLRLDARALVPVALEGLKDANPNTRATALELLFVADPRHENLLAKAREHLKEDATRYSATALLARMGESAAGAVPDLIKLLEGGNDTDRRYAADALAQIGPAAKEAGAALVAQLARRDPSLQSSAVVALSRVKPDPKPIVPKLVSFVKDPKNRSNYAVIAALGLLGEYGPKASEAGPDLLAVLKDATQSAYQRGNAGLALARVDPALAKKEGVAVLRAVQRIQPANFTPSHAILVADAEDREAAAHFEGALKSANPNTRATAAQAAAALGPLGKKFAPRLRELLKDPSYYTRGHAALALYRATGDAREALATLRSMLRDDREMYARGYAAFVLGEMGAAAKPAWESLLLLRKDRDMYPRQQAEFALKKIDPAGAAKAGVY